ncbi:MAG: phosphatidylserine decarboxylase family protein [Bacteroidetes bacterium]|nr:phosphatidylserine decarboxylase family protein [Bacteroidota bacterium]
MITHYGYNVVIGIIIIVAALITVSIIFIGSDILKYLLIIFSILLLAFTFYFFRDPERTTPQGENIIIAPADGKIIFVKEVFEDKFLKSDAVQVSIFMSPLNVHINRFPVSGQIEYFEHIPGKYLVAFEDKASKANERTLIGVDNGKFKLLFKQIAGFIARRIVADLRVGMKTTAGERFGMIKFGSRVDVIMPKNAVIKIKVNDTVKAGETILAEIN